MALEWTAQSQAPSASVASTDDISGPCESWDTVYTCDVSMRSPDCLEKANQAATTVAWALSGRRFGLCTVKLRPCQTQCVMPGWLPWTGTWSTTLLNYYWPIECDVCYSDCSCSFIQQIALPYPVHDVIEVRIDGTPLVTGAYRVDDNRKLVRIDGKQWPLCNNLGLSDTSVGTWTVTARYGLDAPYLGKLAVGELACEFAKAFDGEDCRIPARVQQLVRQGVTIQYPEMTDLLTQGRTGLYFMDMFISTYNPAHLARRSRAFSVDGRLARRTGT